MKKMMAMLLASVMAAGTFTTTAFAYTGDDVQKNTSVSTAAQEADAAGSANAGKTDNTDSIENGAQFLEAILTALSLIHI